MAKRNFYFPPKKKGPAAPSKIKVGDDVKAELMKIATDIADREIERRKEEDLNNYIAFTVEALSRLGWTGKTRLNRFLGVLTEVCSEATEADDAPAYVEEIKERFRAKGVQGMRSQEETAAPQLEGET